jgi:lauroyl/myristoyl acyltransferase
MTGSIGVASRRRTYNAALERMILRHPEQWWWVHRRWKAWPSRATRDRASPARSESG